jgi:HSP20 family molecular chaperone IbpA
MPKAKDTPMPLTMTETETENDTETQTETKTETGTETDTPKQPKPAKKTLSAKEPKVPKVPKVPKETKEPKEPKEPKTAPKKKSKTPTQTPVQSDLDSEPEEFNRFPKGVVIPTYLVKEGVSSYEVLIPAPGFKATDIQMVVERGNLVIVGNREIGTRSSDDMKVKVESTYEESNGIRFAYLIPTDVDVTRTEGFVEQGLVTVKLYKRKTE